MVKRLKEIVRVRTPGLFNVARASKDRAMIEYRMLRSLRPLTLMGRLVGRRQNWQHVLPLQKPLFYELPAGATGEQLMSDLLRTEGVSLGGHVAYLSPEIWRRSQLRFIATYYPPDAGLKIVRAKGAIDDGRYILGSHHSRLQAWLMYPHRLMVLVANALARFDLGPRLYDLTEIRDGADTWVAYVVQHVPNAEPTSDECARGILSLRSLAKSRILVPINPDGFNHPDFACPGCSGNAKTSEQGKFKYIDFQNFVLGNYGKFLATSSRSASEASHFGQSSVFRGGKYLYQSVPTVRAVAKRDVRSRMSLFQRLLADYGLTLHEKYVLDVGCNLGMMMGEYLALGARWCHGWDKPEVVKHANNLLLALGCTRYSLTGVDLQREHSLLADLPRTSHGAQFVLSYLAVRGHLGWLTELRSIPWKFMLYEGHEGEDLETTYSHLRQLSQLVAVDVVCSATAKDGDSGPRQIAIVRRVPDRGQLADGGVNG
jgi:hypothetical protein